jgi:hypothetical protein
LSDAGIETETAASRPATVSAPDLLRAARRARTLQHALEGAIAVIVIG